MSDESRYAKEVEESVRGWVQDEHPDHPALAQRAGHLAAGLFAEGASLGEACRAAYAYVAHHLRSDHLAAAAKPQDAAMPAC